MKFGKAKHMIYLQPKKLRAQRLLLTNISIALILEEEHLTIIGLRPKIQQEQVISVALILDL